MASVYRVDFFSKTDGAKYAEVFDYLELGINSIVNAPGMISIVVEADHAVLEDLTDYDLVEVYRKDPEKGIDWTLEFGGVYAGIEHIAPEGEPPKVTILAFDYKIFLAWRIVAYLAETNNRSAFSNVKGETLAKTLVNTNLGPGATDSNRKLTGGVQTGIAIETDQGRGNNVTISCAYRNLLEVLQEVAIKGGGDFDFVRTSGNTLTFTWYPGQLGTDRRDEVTFSLDRGNMREPLYRKNRVGERTKMLIGLGGEGQGRVTLQRTSGDYSSGNHKEVFLDARDLESTETTEAYDRADTRLKEYTLEETLTFEIAQVTGCLYGEDYFLGDLVQATNPFTGSTEDYKIIEITLTCSPEGEQETEVEVERYA